MAWKILTFAFLYLTGIQCIDSWKPVTGPTSFSIRQSHPSVVPGSSPSYRATNTLVEPTANSDGFLSLHGADFEQSSVVPYEDEGFGSGYADLKSKFLSSPGFPEDTCSVDKYAFDHEGTVQYKQKIQKMEQFTLCVWMRFTNHSGDHTIFTYSVHDEPREIQFWVANSQGSSFISMAVHGQSLYRLNYPLKMRVWHHACSSWNGKTGEWQLWLKAERIGRGFHNRLVGHVIDSNGLAFSGGPSITGKTADSLHFELTLLQIYKVALSAGKAHRDHKHHHVHQFDHNGPITTTTTPPPAPSTTAQPNPLLANGQIPSRVRINLAGVQNNQQQSTDPSQVSGSFISQTNSPSVNTNFVNGQFNSADRFLSEQLSGTFVSSGLGRNPQQAPITFPGQSDQAQVDSFTSIGSGNGIKFFESDNENVRFLFKRGIKTKGAGKSENEKKINKRGLVMLDDGSIVDDSLLSTSFEFDGLAQFGLPAFKEDLQKRMNIEDEIKEHDQEPAEGEVKAVMEVCTSCDVEPFKGAVALTWKNLRVSLEGALKGRSVGGCGYF